MLLMLFNSCVDLDLKPLGQPEAGKIESEEQAFLRLTAVYSDLKDFRYTWSMTAFGDVLSEDATYSGSDDDAKSFVLMENYQYQAEHGEILNKYRQTYQCINKANLFIHDLEQTDDNIFSKYNKDHMLGEAKFIRAYSYFELVKTFGGVPLYTEVLSMDHKRLERSSVEKVYEAIEKDLEDAVASLPSKKEIKDYDKVYAGRIVLGAAYAMQTRVYLYNKKYDLVKKAAKELFKLDEYKLVDDYQSQFLLGGEHGSESLMEVNMYESPNVYYWNTNNGNRHVLMSMPRSITYGFGVAQPTKALAEAYDKIGDVVRKNGTLLSSVEAAAIEEAEVKDISDDRTGFYNRKSYLGPEERAKVGGNNQPLNIKLIRLAEVYLNYAEACVLSPNKEEGEAKKYLKLIRDRAKLPAIESTGDQLFEDIINERRLELGMEGFRFFDIARIGWGPKVFNGFKKGDEVLPIPDIEISINKGTIVQNEYEPR